MNKLKEPKTPSARIHILVARDVPIAIVFRRGPTRQVCTIEWDLKTDKFKLGQWLKGRIYERRSHISPDGKHMIYFAMNGHLNSETKGSWTAISKVPYLKAITLYAKGDCWNGGGLFFDNKNYLLNELYPTHKLLHDRSNLTGKRGVLKDVPYANNECLGIYYARLLGEGWKLNVALSNATVQIFDKKWTKTIYLRKYAHVGSDRKINTGVYWDAHALVNRKGTIKECPNWGWADVINRKLAWAEDGKLFTLKNAGPPDPKNLLKGAKMLKDFNLMRFENILAPY